MIGQNPEAQFAMNSLGCLGENIILQNQSLQALRYEWDICQGDLSLSPIGSSFGAISGSNTPTGVDIVFDGIEWYAFITSRDNHSIIRISLGSDMSALGAVVNLGNVGSLLDYPTDIKIVSDNGKWYGFVFNEGANIIDRLDFGASLTNTPTASIVLNTPIIRPFNQGLDLINDGTLWYVIYTFNSQVGVLRLSTVESIPLAEDQLLTSPLNGNPSLGDIKLLADDGSYYAYTCSFASPKLYRLSFSNNLFSQPIESDLSASLPPAPPSLGYYGLDGGYDAGYHLIFSTLQGDLVRVDLGEDLIQTPSGSQVLGNLGVFFNTVKNRLIKHKSSWLNFSVDYANGTLFKASFPSPTCQFPPGLLTDTNLQISFDSPGVKYISLTSFNGGAADEEHKSITISSFNAPIVEFTTQQVCIQNPTQFAYTSDQSINSQNWDFGDGQTSSSAITQNTYASAASYDVRLNVVSSNGCTNSKLKSIKIYSQPSSSFTLPSGLICTNNEFTFANTTVDNFDGNLSYQWYIDNIPEDTTRNLIYTFSSGGSKDIKLITSIPGCSNELTKTLNDILLGPTVGFDYAGQCEKELIQFNNTSSGNISGYQWDFGNGKTGTAVHETQSYSSIGNYVVSLQTTGANGCISSTSKPLTIYTQPQPDFSLDLPPFSCAGTPSQFNDLTPGPIDSNLSQWNWSFGDPENGIAELKNPTYTYALAGSYTVSLTTTTNFGCFATKVKTIQIAESPNADFSISASCLNQPTYFIDASGATNKAWLWKVGNSSYTIQNPSHVFSESGAFTAQLAVTGNNDCVSVLSKPIDVPIPPMLDFSVQNNCSSQSTVFTDVSSQNSDPAVLREWDFAGLGNGSGESAQFSFSTPGTYSVKLNVTNQSGCLYAMEKNTSIEISPVADFISSDESGPPPLFVQFTNTSLNATSYEWKFNDADSTVSQMESPSFTYLTLGDFMVELTARSDQGCVDAKSKEIHIIVPLTEIELEDFTLLLNATTGSVRPVLSIRNNSNYTLNSVEVVLDIAGNALVKEKISAAILPNTSSSQILNYELLAGGNKLDYLCAELSLTEDRLSDDIDFANNSACISLESTEILFPPYPNPVQGELHMEWISAVKGSVKVSVVTQMGQLAYQKDVPGVGIGLNQIILDLSRLNSGFYMLIFESTEIRKTFPFVILN